MLIQQYLIVALFVVGAYSQCDHQIYCRGDILHTVQEMRIYQDSMTFVDMPMKYDVDTTLNNWKLINKNNVEDVKQFLTDNFMEAGSDLEEVIPSDFNDSPAYLDSLNGELKQFASEINQFWKKLNKKFKDGISSSKIDTPESFFVPGGRFRTYFYWDTKWVIDGLLSSGMKESAKKMQQNFKHMIQSIGYVPNGARIYFLGRSQPMMFPLITRNIQEDFEGSFDALMTEFRFFYDNRGIRACQLFENAPCDVKLYHYDADIDYPRPESYKEDYEMSKKSKVKEFYRNVAAGAESGWDFTVRWFGDGQNMETIRTIHILPVDLNVLLVLNMRAIAEIAGTIGKYSEQQFFEFLAKNTEKVILENFYNENTHQWNDYDMEKKQLNDNFYPSNFFPLLLTKVEQEVIEELAKLINQFPGGIPTSLIDSKQQWDFPNAWPPLTQLIIEGLLVNERNELALTLAQHYIDNAYCSYLNSKEVYGEGYMFEKYDATTVGKQGGGGEYEVQVGFGWTNGVTIWIFQQFGGDLMQPQC